MTDAPYRVRVTVRLNPGVNDPQGLTVKDGLQAIGFGQVVDVRVGKLIDLVLTAKSAEEARARVEAMCRDLLANPVIETFDIEIVPDRGPG